MIPCEALPTLETKQKHIKQNKERKKKKKVSQKLLKEEKMKLSGFKERKPLSFHVSIRISKDQQNDWEL